MSLKGSQTEQNLKDAFAGESQANRRYLYFAAKADVEGYNDVAAVFRSTAEGETGHAHGHLEYLEETGDPATGLPIGGTSDNLKAAIAGTDVPFPLLELSLPGAHIVFGFFPLLEDIFPGFEDGCLPGLLSLTAGVADHLVGGEWQLGASGQHQPQSLEVGGAGRLVE